MVQRRNWLVMGAWHGLGLAAVKYLLEKRQQVVAQIPLSDFRTSFPDNTLLEIVTFDPFSYDQISQAAADILNRYGAIDTLINNAAISSNFMHLLFPLMRKNANAHIIDLSPGCGPVGIADFSYAQAVSLSALSEQVCLEANDLGIKITCIEQVTPMPLFSNN